MLSSTSGPRTRLTPAEAEILRVVSDASTPVFVTVHANGRRRYSYWRAVDSSTGRGGCYVALPTADCDQLHVTGRITLGDPVTDPARTTYRVRAASTSVTRPRTSPVPARVPVQPTRAVRERVRAA